MSATIAGRAAAAGGLGAIGGVGTQALAAGAIGGAGGLLFGLSYGTAIRIGYEQIYPALFPKSSLTKADPNLNDILTKLETLYDFIGGKAAHVFGMEQGLNAATKAGATPLEPIHDLEAHPSGLNFLETLDNFFTSITQPQFAFGHTEGNNNPDKFNIPDPNLANEPSDADLFNQTLQSDKQIYLNKIKNYSTQDLTNLLSYVTVTSQQKIWVKELLNSPAHNRNPTFINTKEITDAKQPVALTWLTNRDNAINFFHTTVKNLKASTSSGAVKQRIRAKALNWKNELRKMSNDYRHSNNFIRTQALLLRKLLATPAFIVPL